MQSQVLADDMNLTPLHCPGWAPAHGGALRLFPFGAAPVDIAPRHDRLVLFASTRMLHRYCTCPRFAAKARSKAFGHSQAVSYPATSHFAVCLTVQARPAGAPSASWAIAALLAAQHQHVSVSCLCRVMPASAQRVCFTIWLTDARRQPRPPPPSELLRDALQQAADRGGRLPDGAVQQLLRQPDVQKLAAKLHYAEEWAASIQVACLNAWISWLSASLCMEVQSASSRFVIRGGLKLLMDQCNVEQMDLCNVDVWQPCSPRRVDELTNLIFAPCRTATMTARGAKGRCRPSGGSWRWFGECWRRLRASCGALSRQPPPPSRS